MTTASRPHAPRPAPAVSTRRAGDPARRACFSPPAPPPREGGSGGGASALSGGRFPPPPTPEPAPRGRSDGAWRGSGGGQEGVRRGSIGQV
eukprot:1139387-Prorocentrum_minimum.AAC.1